MKIPFPNRSNPQERVSSLLYNSVTMSCQDSRHYRVVGVSVEKLRGLVVRFVTRPSSLDRLTASWERAGEDKG